MKKLKAVVIIVACVFLLGGCGNTYAEEQQDEQNSMFVEVEQKLGCYRVVYHKDTKVMYAVSYGASNCGTFTLLVNPDGTPMIYEEESE